MGYKNWRTLPCLGFRHFATDTPAHKTLLTSKVGTGDRKKNHLTTFDEVVFKSDNNSVVSRCKIFETNQRVL